MKDTKNAGYKAPAFDRYIFCLYVVPRLYDCFYGRIAVLQGQLLQVREKIRRAEYEHSRKAGGPSDSDEQDLCELETRERNILDKIADAKQQLEREEIDDSINIGYRCDRCEKIIEGITWLSLCSILYLSIYRGVQLILLTLLIFAYAPVF